MSEARACNQCGQNFAVAEEDLDFLKSVSPVISGETYLISPSKYCYECREQQRLAWRNDRYMFKRKSDKTGREIIAIYPPNQDKYKIWENDLWTKDDWDPMDFGLEYDSGRSFFEHFGQLLHSIPRQATNTTMNENSDYSNHTWKSKNLYLCFNAGPAEDCYYSSEAWWVKNCSDCLYLKHAEYCYSCFNIHNSSNCYYSEQLDNCSEAYFSFDCIGCHNIFMCANLRNKNFCIENVQYSKDEYENKILEYELGKRSKITELKNQFKNLKLNAIHKEHHNQKTENSTGDYLIECKDCEDCYYSHTSENCKRILNIDSNVKDCQDCDFMSEADHCYGSTSVAGHKNHLSVWMIYGSDSMYCNFCDYLNDCFGCVGLKHKKYCILNKQYSREEYEKLLPKIINKMKDDGEWGEFVPMKYSYFNYNESVANLYFPLSKEQAIELGANWQDEDYSLRFDGEAYKPLNEIDNYRDESKQKELLSGILRCEVTEKAYKIMPQELVFYLNHNIPIPTVHSEERYMELFRQRNPRKLFKRQCDCADDGHGHQDQCDVRFETTYSPEPKEKVYCEKCYEKSLI